MNILATYRLIYWNGIKQKKNLIRQADYDTIIKPKLIRIHELENLNLKKEAKALKREIEDEFGKHYFTDESALFKAIDTGIIILPEKQGGNKSVKIELI